MGEIFQLPDILLKSIFVGFGVVIPILKFTKSSDLKTIAVKDTFVLTAVQVLRIAGLLFFFVWLANVYDLSLKPVSDHGTTLSFTNRLFGPYWLHYAFSPLMYLLLSQLFWIKKLYLKKTPLITLAILLLILPSERILIIVTSFHRDYLPSSWAMYTINPVLHFVLNIIVFIFIIIPVMLLTGKLKKLS